MNVGDLVTVSGCVTKEKFIAGRTLAEIEKILGFHRHDPNMNPDIQYPPGYGAPQWIAKVPWRGRVVAVVTDYPNGRCVAAAAVRR